MNIHTPPPKRGRRASPATELAALRADKAKLETALVTADQGRQSAIALRETFARQLETLHADNAALAVRATNAEKALQQVRDERLSLQAHNAAITLAKMELAARVEALQAERSQYDAVRRRLAALTERAKTLSAGHDMLRERERRHLRIMSGLSARLGLLESDLHERDDGAAFAHAVEGFDHDLRNGGDA